MPLDEATVPAPATSLARVSLTDALLARSDSDDLMVEVLSATGGPSSRWTYRRLIGAALVLAQRLRELADAKGAPLRVGLLAGNSAEWVVADLAALFARAVEIPVPTAFTAGQARYLLAEADICLVDAQGAARLATWTGRGAAAVVPADCTVTSVDLPALTRAAPHGRVPALRDSGRDGVVKVVHTSGTTSAPKGVRIRLHGIEALLTALQGRVEDAAFARYLSVVPLSLLIEQVAGLYMPFLAGGSVTFLPPGTALIGTAGNAGPRMLSLMRQARPTAMVVPPVMASLLLAQCEEQPDETRTRRFRRLFGHDGPVFIACGGAPVPVEILRRLAGFGIPVYEGYGLSENSSVVSWNFPGQCRLGTVGRPLEHVRAELAEDGELLVSGPSLFAGYAGEDPSSIEVDDRGRLHTGDLAAFDADGYLRITGRKKSVVITSGGRNVSPEWVEGQYRQLPVVRDAAIVADGTAQVLGLFVIDAAADPADARRRIEAFGHDRLSDVERAAAIVLMSEDDPDYTTCFTVTGRPRRDVIRAYLPAHSAMEKN